MATTASFAPRRLRAGREWRFAPRVLKSKSEQSGRVRDMAEVFTPAWVVKMMVDYVDIDICTRTLELTCGEAPFLVSRYDATTGEPLPIGERVGVLDRKLRLVGEQQYGDDGEWLDAVRLAFQPTYGYEWQGDSLLLARENLLLTYIDHYEARYATHPDATLLQEFAEIISWNLWQMDGLTYRLPREKQAQQTVSQCDFFLEPEPPAPLCIIKDWQTGNTAKVIDCKMRHFKQQDSMKFDVIIGNPPYQEEVEENGRSNPIYNYFMDEAYKVGNEVELITPARFLFNAGQTPKAWNKSMLHDEHFKVLHYEPEAVKVFPNTDIKGGVAISYRNAERKMEAIISFIPYNELRRTLDKVRSYEETNNVEAKSLSDITVGAVPYRFTENVRKDYKQLIDEGKMSSSFDLRSNVIDNLENILFFQSKPQDGNDYVKIFGLLKTKRAYLWIRRDYISVPSNFETYKVFLPESNGSGAFETLANPMVAEPLIGHTQTFISMGEFGDREEAERLLKYLKTKFCRALLGTLKTTQHNSKATWSNVPLQDFSSSSDIDWSLSISEIDEQLFVKYGLDASEREFIRRKVKEMG